VRLSLRLGAGAVALMVAFAAVGAAASAPYCTSSQAPAFVPELAGLKARLGAVMGEATECAHANPANGDVLQATTTGLAYLRKVSGIPTFTTGGAHWALTAAGLLTWAGGSVDPPASARLVPTAAPTSPPTPTSVPDAPRGAGPASVPPCPADIAPMFTVLPMALDNFLAFRPLGFLSPPIHVFPAKHSSFTLALPGQTPPRRPVYFPGDVWVTEVNVAEWEGRDQAGYGVTFYPCREFKLYFGHLSSVSEPLRAAMQRATVACNPPYASGGATVKGCRYLVSIKVSAGDLAGTSGDAAGVDFGAIDYRTPPLAFVRPEHYLREMLHYVSPVPYFVPAVRARLETKLRSYDGKVPRTAAPSSAHTDRTLPVRCRATGLPLVRTFRSRSYSPMPSSRSCTTMSSPPSQ